MFENKLEICPKKFRKNEDLYLSDWPKNAFGYNTIIHNYIKLYVVEIKTLNNIQKFIV